MFESRPDLKMNVQNLGVRPPPLKHRAQKLLIFWRHYDGMETLTRISSDSE